MAAPGKAKAGEGNAPGRSERLGEQEVRRGPWRHGGEFPTGSGIKPLKRGHLGTPFRGARSDLQPPGNVVTRRLVRGGMHGPDAERRTGRFPGGRRGTSGSRCRSRRPKSQEGRRGSRGPATAVREGSEREEPRGRARLKHTGEMATGGRRRSRRERQGRNVTRSWMLRGWWLVAFGLRRGGGNLVRAGGAGGRHPGDAGKTLEWSGRPRKACLEVRASGTRRANTTRWRNHEVGSPNQ